MNILSEFLYDQKRLSIPFARRRMIFNPSLFDPIDFTVNGLPVLHERYTEGLSENFSHLKETALITERIIARNDPKKIIITINPIVSVNQQTNEVIIKKHGSNLISYDGGKIWLTTIQNFDLDGNVVKYDYSESNEEVDAQNAHCDHLVLLGSSKEIIKRTYIENSMYLEKDGQYYQNGIPAEFIPRPVWCMMPKL